MASKTPQEIKAALAKRLEVLREQHANPLQKHPLFPYADELKLMRGKLALSLEQIHEELKQQGLETSIGEIKSFFKLVPVAKRKIKKDKAASAT